MWQTALPACPHRRRGHNRCIFAPLPQPACLPAEHRGVEEPAGGDHPYGRAASGVRWEAVGLEHEISQRVNTAYGLTDDEVRLMWQTAPPRMPTPPGQM